MYCVNRIRKRSLVWNKILRRWWPQFFSDVVLEVVVVIVVAVVKKLCWSLLVLRWLCLPIDQIQQQCQNVAIFYTSFFNFIFASLWEGCEVLRYSCLYIRIYVCLSARTSQKPHSKFDEIFCTCYRWQINMFSTSSFVDDVIFSHSV